MAVESGFLPPVGEENTGTLGRLWANVWQWFAPGWKDQNCDIITRSTDPDAPDWEQIGATIFYGYAFVSAFTRRARFNIHLNHDYRVGSPVYLHVHWIPSTTGSGTVIWTLDYAIAKGHNQQAFPLASPTTITMTDNAPAVLYQHMITEMTDAQSSVMLLQGRFEPDSVIMCRLGRLAGAPGGTFAGTAYAFYADAHYQVSRFATKNRGPRDSAGNLVGFYR
jgi:hypothetical protein